MTGHVLPPGRYALEDVTIGDCIETGRLVVDTSHIDRFADLTGDRFEIHMSEAGAAKHGFPKRVAHGLLILSLIDGLKNQAAAQLDAVASLGWDWSFSAPVFPGDEIRVVMEVLSARTTKRQDRGILTIDFKVLNQRDEIVQRGFNTLMVLRRPV